MRNEIVTAKHLAESDGFPDVVSRIRGLAQRAHHVINAGEASSAVTARINLGRWLADCECGGAEYVDPDAPIFFCQSCGNCEHGGQVRPVTFPPPETRAAIEALILSREVEARWGRSVSERARMARPRSLPREWLPSESVLAVARQNREFKIKTRRSESDGDGI